MGGHAFGGGFMMAVAHGYRFQRLDRGFMCANEIELGLKMDVPTLQLFRQCMVETDFFETCLAAKRWTAKDALARGLLVDACPIEELEKKAFAFAVEKANLNITREMYAWHKARTPKGHTAKALRLWSEQRLNEKP